jgi:hypothetical protein
MISLETIEREIDELESRETTYRVCERLSWLYTVRDHLAPTRGDDRTQELSGSEFLEACSGVSYPALMRVLDEHMQSLAVVQPRAYSSLLRRIQQLKET